MAGLKAILLSDMIEEQIEVMRSQGRKPASISSALQTYGHFLNFCGNVQVRNITPKKIDEFFAQRARTEKPATLNLRLKFLRNLFKTAALHRYINHDPIGHRRPMRVRPTKKTRIPAKDFPRLLECATQPIYRAATAIGLYAFLRAGEVSNLRIEDVDLDAGILYVYRDKPDEFDEMPICAELDAELRRWLTHYAEEMADTWGPLKPRWYLIPRLRQPSPQPLRDENGQPIRDKNGRWVMAWPNPRYLPDTRVTHPHRYIQHVLEAAGYPIRDEDGVRSREGLHTLRRSGARALYDELRSGRSHHDDANRTVQAMLGHKNFTTTEIYLGLDIDRVKRNTLLAGKPMFPQPEADNVVQLRSANSGAGEE